jgi:hypothetical protein
MLPPITLNKKAQARRTASLIAISLAGLLMAVAGLTPAPASIDNLPARFAIDLPAWLGVTVLAVMGLAGVGIFALMFIGVRQQHRRLEPRKGRILAPLLWLLALLLVWLELRNQPGLTIFETLRTFFATGFAPVSMAPDPDAPPAVASPVLSGLLQALVLALALFMLAVVAWVYLGLLPARRRGAAAPAEHAAFRTAVDESLDDLRNEPDARLAILRCYDRFERLLDVAHVGRLPWQTALEFMRTTLRYPWLPRESTGELTSLFELARFSQHALGPAERERAWQALIAVKAALDRESLRAATA